MKRRVILAGGSGFLGEALSKYLTGLGYDVGILTRSPKKTNHFYWDGESLGDWVEKLEGSFALINMAGKSVNCRYNEKNKQAILSSRINSTHILSKAIDALKSPPKMWLNSSTATIYEDTPGEMRANSETSNKIGSDFSMGVAKAWEAEFFKSNKVPIHKVALRTAIVLGQSGGAFEVMHKLAKIGLAGKQGSGEQWVSWIHIQDFCRSIEFILNNEMPSVVNVVAPNPIQNKTFYATIRKNVRPFISIPQPEWMLTLGAMFMQTETELILKSRKVIPNVLGDAGFSWQFPKIQDAVKNLVGARA